MPYSAEQCSRRVLQPRRVEERWTLALVQVSRLLTQAKQFPDCVAARVQQDYAANIAQRAATWIDGNWFGHLAAPTAQRQVEPKPRGEPPSVRVRTAGFAVLQFQRAGFTPSGPLAEKPLD